MGRNAFYISPEYLANLRALGIDIKCDKNSITMADNMKDFSDLYEEMDRAISYNKQIWPLLPPGLDGDEIERKLYERGSLALVYFKEIDRFLLLPFAAKGIDIDGKPIKVCLVPYASDIKLVDDTKKSLIKYLGTKEYTVIDSIQDAVDYIENGGLIENAAVLLFDVKPGITYYCPPRRDRTLGVRQSMNRIIRYLMTSMNNKTGQTLVYDENGSALDAESLNQQIVINSLTGKKFVASASAIKAGSVPGESIGASSEFLIVLQALENFLKQSYGIRNNGWFEKQAQVLQAEIMQGNQDTQLVYNSYLYSRQRFCMICNFLYAELGYDFWCDVPESLSGIDIDGDGDTTSDSTSTQVKTEKGMSDTDGATNNN